MRPSDKRSGVRVHDTRRGVGGLYLGVSVPCLTGRSNLQFDWAQMLKLLGKENMVIYQVLQTDQFIFRLR